MPAGEVPGFMGQHPDDLVWSLGLQNGAEVHENPAAVGDKRVKGAVINNDNLNVLFFETGGGKNGPGVFAQQLLGFGVADYRRALLLRQSRAGWGNRKRCRPLR